MYFQRNQDISMSLKSLQWGVPTFPKKSDSFTFLPFLALTFYRRLEMYQKKLANKNGKHQQHVSDMYYIARKIPFSQSQIRFDVNLSVLLHLKYSIFACTFDLYFRLFSIPTHYPCYMQGFHECAIQYVGQKATLSHRVNTEETSLKNGLRKACQEETIISWWLTSVLKDPYGGIVLLLGRSK